MGRMVIVAFRPKPGREDDLLALTRDHVPQLRRLGLVGDTPSLVMRAKDGCIVEVFDWKDGAIEKAHDHPDILQMWDCYAAVCDYVPLKDLTETADMFAEFEPITL